MRQIAVTLLICGVLCGALSCGGGFLFISTNGTNASFLTVSGTVTVVRLTITSDGQFTVVTLINSGNGQTFNFCGDRVTQFPVDTFITVNFTHNGGCDNVVRIQ